MKNVAETALIIIKQICAMNECANYDAIAIAMRNHGYKTEQINQAINYLLYEANMIYEPQFFKYKIMNNP